MAAGAELKRIRLANSKSANSFAKLLGVDVERYRKWEQKDANPREDDAEIVKCYFKIKTLEELAEIDELPKSSGKYDEPSIGESKNKTPDFTQDLINSLKKNIEILEQTNRDQADRVNRLLKSNSDLMLQLQTNLESLTRNHLTSHAMNEAFHEEIVDLLLQVSKQPASVKVTLIENVHNKGVEKMLAYTEKGILIDSHS